MVKEVLTLSRRDAGCRLGLHSSANNKRVCAPGVRDSGVRESRVSKIEQRDEPCAVVMTGMTVPLFTQRDTETISVCGGSQRNLNSFLMRFTDSVRDKDWAEHKNKNKGNRQV